MSGNLKLPVKVVAERRLQPPRKRPRQKITDLTQLPPEAPGRVQNDRDFLPEAAAVVETPYPSGPQWAIALICLTLILAFAAACVFHLTTYAIAPGQIVTSGQAKVVQPLQKGQILSIKVSAGEHVQQGQVLLELDPTAVQAAQEVIVNKLASARAETVRRLAENEGARADPVKLDPPLVWDKDTPQDIIERESVAMRARLQQLAATIANLAAQRGVKEAAEKSLTESIAAEQSLLDALTEQLGMSQKLEKLGWDSHAKVLEQQEPVDEAKVNLVKLKGERDVTLAAIRVLNAEIAEARQTFATDNARRLSVLALSIDDLAQQLEKANFSVKAMTLRAPIAGTVTASQATSKGQVVTPGEQVFSIAPDGDSLEVEAYVLNTDIGFVRKGAPVTIKIDTIPYTRYGVVAGKVLDIASDAISGTQALAEQKDATTAAVSGSLSATAAAQKTSDLVFPVRVALSTHTIESGGRRFQLTSGMSVVAEVETGRTRLLGYILYPLVRSQKPN